MTNALVTRQLHFFYFRKAICKPAVKEINRFPSKLKCVLNFDSDHKSWCTAGEDNRPGFFISI